MAVDSSIQSVQRELWGGACRCVLPERLIDVSDIRPVPDHQEAFADTEVEQALIFEIVEHDASVPDEECPRHYFVDAAEGNDAATSSIEGTVVLGPQQAPGLPEGCFKCLVRGRQVVRRGRAATDTSVLIAIIRLPHVGSDLLVTLSTPLSATAALAESERIMTQALASFRVEQWELFG